MRLFVKTMTGQTVTLDVEQSDLIEHVQHMIADKEGIPIEDQCIVFAGLNIACHNRVCECGGPGNGRTLEDFNIQKESTLHMVGRLRGSLPVCVIVEIPPGKFVTVELASDKVEHVKRVIAEEWGVPVARQELCFEGRSLEDGEHVMECGIKAFGFCKLCKHGWPEGSEAVSTLQLKPCMLTVSLTKEGGDLAITVTNLAGQEVVAVTLSADAATLGDLREAILKDFGHGFLLLSAEGRVLAGSDHENLEVAMAGP